MRFPGSDWSRTDKIALVAVIVAAIGVVIAYLALPPKEPARAPRVLPAPQVVAPVGAEPAPISPVASARAGAAPVLPAGESVRPATGPGSVLAMQASMRQPADPRETYQDRVARLDAGVEACDAIKPELANRARAVFEAKIGSSLPELRSWSFYAERLPQWRTIYSFQVNESAAGQGTACEGILSIPLLTMGM